MAVGVLLSLIFILTGAAADLKPGRCPSVDSGQVGICEDECAVDLDCIGNQKCCSNGCGKTCQHAEQIGIPHGGVCPAVNNSKPARCFDPAPCSVDSHCRSSDKCCSTGCSFVCVVPERVEENRPGLCPAEIASHQQPRGQEETKRNCSSVCGDDRDCPEGQKCCRDDVCGLTCVETVSACYYNGKTYRDFEDIVGADGCSSGCVCMGGRLACAQAYCGLRIDKTRILTVCLIGLGLFCLIGATLSFVMYQISKKRAQDNDRNKKEVMGAINHDLHLETHPSPAKV